MAEEKKEEAKKDSPDASKEASPPSEPKGPLILAIVNTLAIAGVLGLFVYTQLIYKRPAITEQQEREKLEKAKNIPDPESLVPGQIEFEPFTLNIQSTLADQGQPVPQGSRPRGKVHYATISFTLEVRDEAKIKKFENIRPKFKDRLVQMLGHRGYEELTTIQGRYILRTDILELANQLVEEPLITQVYFTSFIVQ